MFDDYIMHLLFYTTKIKKIKMNMNYSFIIKIGMINIFSMY